MRWLFILMLPLTANAASTCYVVANLLPASVVFQYPEPCNQAAFSGDLGDASKTTHLSTTDFLAADAARAAASSTANARLQRIKAACASQTNPLIQDICNQVGGN